MSNREQLERAINAHVLDIASEDLAIVKDWVIVAAVASPHDEDERESIFIERSVGTSLYAVTGLLTWGLEAYDGEPI